MDNRKMIDNKYGADPVQFPAADPQSDPECSEPVRRQRDFALVHGIVSFVQHHTEKACFRSGQTFFQFEFRRNFLASVPQLCTDRDFHRIVPVIEMERIVQNGSKLFRILPAGRVGVPNPEIVQKKSIRRVPGIKPGNPERDHIRRCIFFDGKTVTEMFPSGFRLECQICRSGERLSGIWIPFGDCASGKKRVVLQNAAFPRPGLCIETDFDFSVAGCVEYRRNETVIADAFIAGNHGAASRVSVCGSQGKIVARRIFPQFFFVKFLNDQLSAGDPPVCNSQFKTGIPVQQFRLKRLHPCQKQDCQNMKNSFHENFPFISVSSHR